MLTFMHVLFVCTGNICRSPSAERLVDAFAKELGRDDITAASAGTHAQAGRAIEPTAAQVLAGLGGDPSGFAARLLTPEIIAGADLVLTMTEQHREKVLAMAPTFFAKTFTLKEAVRLSGASGATTISALAEARRDHLNTGAPEDISDPMSKSEDVFLAVGSEIAELVGTVVSAIRS